jgi:hypothetical protein
VTKQSFNEWKTRFDGEVHLRKTRDEEDKLKAMTGKEREEYKKIAVRLTGGCVFSFGCRCQSFVFQDVNFSSATKPLLRPMHPYWKTEPCLLM